MLNFIILNALASKQGHLKFKYHSKITSVINLTGTYESPKRGEQEFRLL